MGRTWLVLSLTVSLMFFVAACGSDKEASKPPPKLLPNVNTSDEWALRIVDRFLRPLNKDLQVLNGLNSPDIRVFIASGNQQTIGIVNRHMKDLSGCTEKLVVIGPPTTDDAQFQRVDRLFHEACRKYEDVAASVLEAVPLLSSGRQDVLARGGRILRETLPVSRAAALKFQTAINIAQTRVEFRNAGLQPST
jgi:hypothetical protein